MLWTLDPTHTTVEFSVKHLGIATVKGRFKGVSATADTAADGTLVRIEATIDASTIDTGVEQRDQHLRSPDFFDVAQFPTITFASTGVRSTGAGRWAIDGTLTMRGEARPVSFTLTEGGAIDDPWGNRRIASTATGRLSRKDWGLTWNQALELGGVVVSDEVKFTLEVQVVAPRAAAA